MGLEALAKISTQWTQMETLMETDGPAALADYLAAKYFEVLATRIKKYRPNIDDLKAHELASEVIYQLIKNDYQGIHRLERDKGKLRGLFFTIIRRTLIREEQKKIDYSYEEFDKPDNDQWLDIYIDFYSVVEKLQQQKPHLYQAFVYYYLEGKSIAEIAELLEIKKDATKQRLHKARIRLSQWLKDYQKL